MKATAVPGIRRVCDHHGRPCGDRIYLGGSQRSATPDDPIDVNDPATQLPVTPRTSQTLGGW